MFSNRIYVKWNSDTCANCAVLNNFNVIFPERTGTGNLRLIMVVMLASRHYTAKACMLTRAISVLILMVSVNSVNQIKRTKEMMSKLICCHF